MARSPARSVTRTLAELTDRSEIEIRLAMTGAAAGGALIALLRLINYLDDLGFGSRPHHSAR